ncbi:DUF1501 domain-containing protein [bacterium]|nr:DUF1501 domain-containing protein [bacterium]
MLKILHRGTRLCDGLNRRELLRIGSLAVGGLSLPSLLQARDSLEQPESAYDRAFGRAKNIIFLYLAGGPPQHETFDPKPDAPLEIRGPFRPISTTIPGIQFCELLPRTSLHAEKLAVIRSMSTDDNVHSSSGAWVLTGHKYRGPNPRTISPTDWPYFGSIVKRQRPSNELPALSTVWLPDVMRLNENVTPAGQTAGFMGPQWNPEVFVGDPSQSNYEIESLRTDSITPLQLDRRQSLLTQLESRFDQISAGTAAGTYGTFQQQAFDLLTSGKARHAFDISSEPDKVRDRYGRNRWGQCVLLARRLIEAGVRLVHVQWPREPGDNAVDNPLWDTHAQNADRVEDVLCPMFDVGFSALLEDLDDRGLLDETLVVAIGEFGRTPKINAKGGRDHWGPVFSFAMAGAGISGGQVYGASDRNGAYPAIDRVDPGHLTATMFHLLGLSHLGSFLDRQNRPNRLTEREPLFTLLGTEPATVQRVRSTGDIARVPDFDPKALLKDTAFSGNDVLKPIDAPSRPKGWRATPLLLTDRDGVFGVRHSSALTSDPAADSAADSVFIGLRQPAATTVEPLSGDARAILAQEVRSPFAGTYRFRVRLRGEATSAEFFDAAFRNAFTCRISFYQYTTQQKSLSEVHPLASLDFTPELCKPGDDWQTVELVKQFVNPNPGANFSFGAGMGVMLEVTRRSKQPLQLPAAAEPQSVGLRIADVTLEFLGKERIENVKV